MKVIEKLLARILSLNWTAFFLGAIIATVLTQPSNPVLEPNSIGSEYVIGLIQLVALYFPALFILMDFLLSYQQKLNEIVGRPTGIGMLDFDRFRRDLLLFALISSAFLTTDLVILFYSVQPPFLIGMASVAILLGIGCTPLFLFYIFSKSGRDSM